MNWLSRNAPSVEAVAASITAVTAILAVAGVIVQLRAADATSRAQSAREAYAAHLALAVANPEFAAPPDACALATSARGAAYQAYLDHLLYAAEQMLAVEDGWDETFTAALEPHTAMLCSAGAAAGAAPDLMAVLAGFRADACPDVTPCNGAAL
jgi:hypothetical protein